MDGFNIRGMPFTQASASAAPVIAIGSAATSRYAAVGRPCRPPPVRTGSSSTPEAPPEREMAKGAAECAPVPGWRRRNWSQRHTPFLRFLVRRHVEGGSNSPGKAANPESDGNPGKYQGSDVRYLSERICPQARRAREAALRSRPSTER